MLSTSIVQAGKHGIVQVLLRRGVHPPILIVRHAAIADHHLGGSVFVFLMVFIDIEPFTNLETFGRRRRRGAVVIVTVKQPAVIVVDEGALDLVDVVLGQVLEDVANVDIFFDRSSVQTHVALLGKSFNLFTEKRNITLL